MNIQRVPGCVSERDDDDFKQNSRHHLKNNLIKVAGPFFSLSIPKNHKKVNAICNVQMATRALEVVV